MFVMAKEYAKAFYNSAAWIKCKNSYIKSVHGLCERCGEPGYIVHHKKYITPKNINDPSITLNHDNLEYLCQKCHNEEHERFKKKKFSLIFKHEKYEYSNGICKYYLCSSSMVCYDNCQLYNV